MLLRDAVKAYKGGRKQLPRNKQLTKAQEQAADFLLNAVVTGNEPETAWQTFEQYVSGGVRGWGAHPFHKFGKQLWEVYLQNKASQAYYLQEDQKYGGGTNRRVNTRAINTFLSEVKEAKRKWSLDFQDCVDWRWNTAMAQVFKVMEDSASECAKGQSVPLAKMQTVSSTLDLLMGESRELSNFASGLSTDWDIFCKSME